MATDRVAGGAVCGAVTTSVSHCDFDLVGYKMNQEKKIMN
jgi:hypothetical protein